MRSISPIITHRAASGQRVQQGPSCTAPPHRLTTLGDADQVLSPCASGQTPTADATYLMQMNPTAGRTIRLPLEGASEGRYIWIDVQAAQNVTLQSSAGVNIPAIGTAANPLNNNQGLVYCDGTTWSLIADY